MRVLHTSFSSPLCSLRSYVGPCERVGRLRTPFKHLLLNLIKTIKMRKLFLCLLALICTLGALAQDKYYTTGMKIALYDEPTNTWKWEEEIPTYITITIYPKDVHFGNKEGTKLHLTGDVKMVNIFTQGGGMRYEWPATDQEGRKCSFYIVTWTNKSPIQYYINYSDIKCAYTMAQ